MKLSLDDGSLEKGLVEEKFLLGKNKLSRGYLFQSDLALSEDKRDLVDGYVDDEGIPYFQSYEVDIQGICSQVNLVRSIYDNPKNIIVLGNGGSISSLKAFYEFLIRYSVSGRYADSERNLYIVDSPEPGPINKIRENCGVCDSLVLAISKSGNTQGVIDVLDVFMQWGYNVCAVTSCGKRSGRIYDIIVDYLKGKGFGGKISALIFDHPPSGGRYSGLTEVSMVPLAFLGLSQMTLEEIVEGAGYGYDKFGPQSSVEGNMAFQLAVNLHNLELKCGVDEIFAAFYSHRLKGFSELATQLLHESSCKDGLGQNITCAIGPECQHHTNQRFFGGKRNIAGVFFTVKDHKSSQLETSDGLPLEGALDFEFRGTYEDALNKNIPCLWIELSDFSPYELGFFMAFMQYAFGVYPAIVRDVNPFDQPQVESSKIISKEKRREYKK